MVTCPPPCGDTRTSRSSTSPSCPVQAGGDVGARYVVLFSHELLELIIEGPLEEGVGGLDALEGEEPGLVGHRHQPHLCAAPQLEEAEAPVVEQRPK